MLALPCSVLFGRCLPSSSSTYIDKPEYFYKCVLCNISGNLWLVNIVKIGEEKRDPSFGTNGTSDINTFNNLTNQLYWNEEFESWEGS